MSKEKVLKVKDLIQIFQTGLVSKQSLEDRVVVATSSTLPTLGGRQTVDVVRAFSGFDWERGKFILITEKKVMTLNEGDEREIDVFRKEYDERAAELWRLKKEINSIRSIISNRDIDNQRKVERIKERLKDFRVGGAVLTMVDDD